MPKRILIFTTFILAFLSKGYSATPVTHIYFAEQWLYHTSSFEYQDATSFIIGNLFPDIRYLGDISRSETHMTNVSLQDILTNTTPFKAGMQLHSYIDEKREELVVKWNIYSLIIDYAEGHPATLLKLIEDEILYNRINIPSAIGDLDHYASEEFDFDISFNEVEKWHKTLQNYLYMRPSYILFIASTSNRGLLNIPAQTIKKWAKWLPTLTKDPHLLLYVEDLVKAFDEDFQNFL